jgi:hypothetical protein
MFTERYNAKSFPFIVRVSTSNAPGGLFERIEKDSERECLYKRLTTTSWTKSTPSKKYRRQVLSLKENIL